MADYNRPDDIPAMPTPPDPTEPRDSFVEKALNVWNWLKSTVQYWNNILTWINDTVLPKVEVADTIGDMSKYLGEWGDVTSANKGESVSIGDVIYISKIDNNIDTPPTDNWIEFYKKPKLIQPTINIIATVEGNETNRIFSYIVPEGEDGVYSLFFSWTPKKDDITNASTIITNFGWQYAFGGDYNGATNGGTAYFSAGDEIFVDMYGGYDNPWEIQSSQLTLLKEY